MQITEEMVTPHHLLAAERWIAANGMPETDSELTRMGKEVAEEARQVVERMAIQTFKHVDAFRQDTRDGEIGREFLSHIYQELHDRA